ncbi:MAG: hypothetical protein ACRDBG_24825 [Waterburya sp.]
MPVSNAQRYMDKGVPGQIVNSGSKFPLKLIGNLRNLSGVVYPGVLTIGGSIATANGIVGRPSNTSNRFVGFTTNDAVVESFVEDGFGQASLFPNEHWRGITTNRAINFSPRRTNTVTLLVQGYIYLIVEGIFPAFTTINTMRITDTSNGVGKYKFTYAGYLTAGTGVSGLATEVTPFGMFTVVAQEAKTVAYPQPVLCSVTPTNLVNEFNGIHSWSGNPVLG